MLIPDFKLTYNKKDITRQVDSYFLEIVYMDRVEGESDELEVKVKNEDGRWSNDWYPDKGARLTLDISDGNKLVPCGVFEIDEVRTMYGVGGHAVNMRALSAIITAPFRTKRKERYENITLSRLAATIAARGKLSVSGDIEKIQLGGVSQFDETDLAFLRRISLKYGYVFNIKSGKLVFTNIGKLQSRQSVDTIGLDRLLSFEASDSTDRTFSQATQKYYDPSTGKVIKYEQQSSGQVSPDALESEGFVENQQQAEIKAKANLAKALNGQIKANATLSTGTPQLLAGNNVQIQGVGKVSGLYNIEASIHRITRDAGYTTEIEIFKIG